MKLFITDQFLWEVCSFFESLEDIAYSVLRRRRTMADIYPLENPIIKKYIKNLTKQQFNKLIYYLKKNNYIKVKSLEGKKAIMLTEKGIDKAFKASFKMEAQNLKVRKDDKWIMLIFDIPKKENKKRDLLRSILKSLGYGMFQKSVWVTPYDVFEKTERSINFYSLDNYIRLLLVEKMR